METGLKLRPGGNGDLDASQGVEGLYKTDEDNLTVQTVVEALDEVAPELRIPFCMHVHAHDNLGTAELAEGVFDAIGYVGGQTYLRLHLYLGGGSLLLQLFQQPKTGLTVSDGFLVIVDHVQGHQTTVQPLVAHQQGQGQQLRGNLLVFDTKEDLLIVFRRVDGCRVIRIGDGVAALGEYNLLGGMLRHHRGNDTGDEDHHHNTIDHVAVGEIDARRHFETHAHHDHRDGTGRMGGGHTEHHVAVALGQTEYQTGDVGGHGFAEGAEEGYEADHQQHLDGGEDGTHVDQHAHTNQEIGDKDRVTDKLDAVHQRGDLGDVSVEDQARQESTEDAL